MVTPQGRGDFNGRSDMGLDGAPEVARSSRIEDRIARAVVPGNATSTREVGTLREVAQAVAVETMDVQEGDVDLGYLALYEEDVPPIQAALRSEAKVVLRHAPLCYGGFRSKPCEGSHRHRTARLV